MGRSLGNIVHSARKSLRLDPLNAFIATTDVDAISAQRLAYHGERSAKEHRRSRGAQRLNPKLKLLAVKDNISTTQLPTTCASGILQGYKSPFEARVVEDLCCSGGCILVGKTNMDEFGMGSHSLNSISKPVINGLNLKQGAREALSAGGSSGGSAVAVQTRQSSTALGTDTGGSVRLPAAYTGQCGFKPSYGRVSRWGVIPYANSLDTVGFVGQSAADAFQIFRKVTHADARDPSCISTATRARNALSRKKERATRLVEDSKNSFLGLKIGVPVEYNIEELDPAVRSAWQNVLEILKERGCSVVPISLPMTKHALSAYYVIAAAEAMSNLAKYDGVRYGSRTDADDNAGEVLYSETRGKGFGDEARRRILLGSYTLSSEAVDNYFLRAQKVRRLVQRDFDRVFKLPNPFRDEQQFDISDLDESIPLDNKLGPCQVDFIVCPTAPTLPPKIQEVLAQTPVHSYMNDVFTVPASLAGLPAISIPVPTDTMHPENKLRIPAGIQIISQFLDDSTLGKFTIELEELIGQALKPVAPVVSESVQDVEREIAHDDVPLVRYLEDKRTFVKESRKGPIIRTHAAGRLRPIIRTHTVKGPRIGRMTVLSRVVSRQDLEEFAKTEHASHMLASLDDKEVDDLFDSTISLWEQRRSWNRPASEAQSEELAPASSLTEGPAQTRFMDAFEDWVDGASEDTMK